MIVSAVIQVIPDDITVVVDAQSLASKALEVIYIPHLSILLHDGVLRVSREPVAPGARATYYYPGVVEVEGVASRPRSSTHSSRPSTRFWTGTVG
jgi:hypothetical protein